MNDSNASGSRRLYLAGSIAALGYLAAQAIQQLIRAAAGTPADAAAELQSHLTTADQVRALLLWLSFWALPIAYYALYVRSVARRPYWARLGLFFSFVFIGCELSYRTIELFVVTRRWTADWAVATGDSRAALVQRIASWDDVVIGWYVLLLTAHVIGTVGFAGAVGWRGRWLDRALFLTLLANAALMFLRVCAYWLPALETFCHRLYFPVVAPSFFTIGAVLFFQARRAAHAGPGSSSAGGSRPLAYSSSLR